MPLTLCTHSRRLDARIEKQLPRCLGIFDSVVRANIILSDSNDESPIRPFLNSSADEFAADNWFLSFGFYARV